MNIRVLLCQYEQSLREARKMLKLFEGQEMSEQDQSDKSLINSMIRDMEFAIEWMKTGRNPDAMKGIDKSGAYTMDPDLLEAVLPNRPEIEDRTLTDHERWLLDDVLADLTQREKDVFVLVRAEGISYEYTAELLGISKSSVQTYLERAERKIENRKNSSLFLVS